LVRSKSCQDTSWQRLLALSGIAFAVLLVAGFFLSGGGTPDYTAADQEWTTWAENNEPCTPEGSSPKPSVTT
jgi:hypothetical protein